MMLWDHGHPYNYDIHLNTLLKWFKPILKWKPQHETLTYIVHTSVHICAYRYIMIAKCYDLKIHILYTSRESRNPRTHYYTMYIHLCIILILVCCICAVCMLVLVVHLSIWAFYLYIQHLMHSTCIYTCIGSKCCMGIYRCPWKTMCTKIGKNARCVGPQNPQRS